MKKWVEVEKLDLMPGEELREVPGKIIEAIGRSTLSMKKSLFLTHVFNDEIVMMDFETRKRWRMGFKRAKNGDVELVGNPVEVRVAFVPVKESTSKADDGTETTTTDAPECIEIEKASQWGGAFTPL